MPIIGGASGGAGGLQKLFDSTLGADAASIDTGAAGIAPGHGLLIISIIAQTDKATTGVTNVALTFNNDSGANYDWQELFNATATSFTAQSAINVTCGHPLAGNTSYPGSATVIIPNYDATTFFKVGQSLGGVTDSATTTDGTQITQLGYRSTTAISRAKIAVTAGSTVLKAGSRLTVYGVQ